MKTEITDAVGVKMAGPDEPALARAKARDLAGVAVRTDARSEEQRSREYLVYTDEMRRRHEQVEPFDVWAERTFCGGFEPAEQRTTRMNDPAYREEISKLGLMRDGSVGQVAQRQAGILPTGGITVTNEMVMRAQSEGMKHENPLGASAVRAMLVEALRG